MEYMVQSLDVNTKGERTTEKNNTEGNKKKRKIGRKQNDTSNIFISSQ